MLYHRRCRANSVTTSAADQKKVSDSFFVAGKVADIMLAYMQHSQNYFDKYILDIIVYLYLGDSNTITKCKYKFTCRNVICSNATNGICL